MKLFKIEFNDLYVEAETEEQANETLYDYLATISANDLESETIETDAWTNSARIAAGIDTVDVINDK